MDVDTGVVKSLPGEEESLAGSPPTESDDNIGNVFGVHCSIFQTIYIIIIILKFRLPVENKGSLSIHV